MMLRQYEEALRDCEKCLALDPSYVRGYLRAGRACLALGHVRDAKTQFTKASSIAVSMFNGDGLLVRDARTGLDQVQLYESMLAQGRVALKNGEIDRTLRRCEKAMELAPHSRDVTLLKIETLLCMKRSRDAMILCTEVLPHAMSTTNPSLITSRWHGADKGIDTQLILLFAKALLYSGDSNHAGKISRYSRVCI